MVIPKKLKKNDRVAIVSLSSGMLGEDFCAHNLQIGCERLEKMGLTPVFMPNSLKGIDYVKNHPEKRAEDLKNAFWDSSIDGIICAIGGDDTYCTIPYLLGDASFIKAVQDNPKLFTGFSDTTVNHLMFYQLGLQTYYGPSFITDLADIGPAMLPYSENSFLHYFEGNSSFDIIPSPIWYEERTDFSVNAVGTPRVEHTEIHGFELLQGPGKFSGKLLGGCLESLYYCQTDIRYPDQKQVCEKYGIFPSLAQWQDCILFFETSEERPNEKFFKESLSFFKKLGIFDVICGIIIGKPQNECYYEEYKNICCEVIDNPSLPILYNVNFGHAYPRTILPYGSFASVDAENQAIHIQL